MNITATISNLLKDWAQSLKRFPLFFIAVMALCVYLSYTIEATDGGKLRIISPLLALALTWLATYIANESVTKGLKNNQLLLLIAPVLAVILYMIIPNDLSTASEWKYGQMTFVTILSLHLMVCLIPFIKNYNEARFLNYNVKLLENFAESALLNLIFYGILSLAVVGITKLFEINILYEIYLHLFVWIAGLFHTTNFLSNFPKVDDESLDQIKFTSRFFKVLLTYILIPSTFVYGLIIYAYTIKLLMQNDIKPWLTEMCIWYFVLGILTYYLSKVYGYAQQNKFVSFFEKYFPIFSILIVIVMFLACNQRINEKGITDENYLLGMLCVAAAAGIIPFAIKKTIDRRILPTVIMLLSIISIIPSPFNLWNASVNNQKSRLEEVLIKNAMLVEGKLSKFSGNFFYGYDTISNALYYLDNKKELEILYQWDKENLLKENAYAYEIMQALNVHQNQSQNSPPMAEVKSEYFIHLPAITFKEGQTLVPLLNRYITVPDTFSGIKINEQGAFDLYKEGKMIETLDITSTDLKKQSMILTSSDKKSFLLYFTNLTYKYEKEMLVVEDIVGVVVD